MKIEVADCSILIKLFVPENESKSAVLWSKGWRAGKFEVTAPELVIAEFTNVIWRKVRKKEISNSIGREIIKDFMKLPLRIVNHSVLVEAAFNLAVGHEITVYDALYAALAYRLNAPLVTADIVLIKKLKSSSVICKTI